MIEELTLQGHIATGALVNNIIIKLVRKDPIEGRMEIFDYAYDLDSKRPPPDNYRQILYNWSFDKPDLANLSNQERSSFTYLAAKKASEEQIPTDSALAYSQNGRRTEWSKNTIDNFDFQDEVWDEWFDFIFEKIFVTP